MDDKLALRVSQAGMRFIAQMTIYNSGDFDRLRQFIGESYAPALLGDAGVDAWLDSFRAQREEVGKLRVRQVIGTGKYHVIVLLEAEKGDDLILSEMKVDEEYPHLIVEYE